MIKFLSVAALGVICVVLGVFLLAQNDVSLKSPIASVQGDNTSVEIVNTWFPKMDVKRNTFSNALSAKSALLVDYDSGEALLEKDSGLRLPAGSTIKIMTALVALEKSKEDSVFTVSKKASEVGEDTMGLTEGEKVKFTDLLYGLMLPSGNDAAITIAENVSGSEDAFVAEMNKMAKSLGLERTKFINASGLDVDGQEQYTTTQDLAVISRYVWEKYPLFRKVTATEHIFIDATDTHKAFDLYNQTNLLATYPGVKGIKPGFTWEAGYCLVTYAENGGKKIIGVLLNSGDRRGEMKELLDFGFGELGVKVEQPALF